MISKEKILEKLRAQQCSNDELTAFLKETNKRLRWVDGAALAVDACFVQIFEALAQNNTVDTLNIINMDLTSLGAALVAKLLQENRRLTSLNMSYCPLPPGEKRMIIIRALKTNDTLLTLDLSGIDLDVKDAKVIAELIVSNKSLTSLNLNRCDLDDESACIILSAMKENSSIRVLNLGDNKLQFESQSKSLPAFIELLKMNRLQLTELDYSHNDTFFLHDDKGATEGKMIAEALQQNKTITRFNINSIQGSRAGAFIFGALKTNFTLQHLYLQENSLMDLDPKTAYQALTQHTQLRTLALGKMKYMSHIQKFISFETWSAIFRAVGEHPGITTLDLEGSLLEADETKLLAEALTQNKSLTHLELRYNPLSEGCQFIYAALLKNRTLLYLGLAKTDLRDYTLSGKSIAEVLKTNQSLQTLVLDDNRLYDSDATDLSNGLRQNRGLKHLSLLDTYISEDGIKPLFNSLEGNRCLTRFDIGSTIQNGDYGIDFACFRQRIMEIVECNLVLQRQRCIIASAFQLSVDEHGKIAMTTNGILLPGIVNLIFQYADCHLSPYMALESEVASQENQPAKRSGLLKL